jgi:hypothetical protein
LTIEGVAVEPGTTITPELLDAIVADESNPLAANLARYIHALRDDHEDRLLFFGLARKHLRELIANLRLVQSEDLFVHKVPAIISDFEETWRRFLAEDAATHPTVDEPALIGQDFVPNTNPQGQDGNGRLHVRWAHWSARVVAAGIAESMLRPYHLDDGVPDAALVTPKSANDLMYNHCTLKMTHRGHKFEVTVQRVGGQTPSERIGELLDANAKLRVLVHESHVDLRVKDPFDDSVPIYSECCLCDAQGEEGVEPPHEKACLLAAKP